MQPESKSQTFKIALWAFGLLVCVSVPPHQAQARAPYWYDIERGEKVGICAIKAFQFYTIKDLTCTHEDNSLETVSINRSIFYGLFLVYTRILEQNKKLLRMIQDEPHDLAKINQIELKRKQIAHSLGFRPLVYDLGFRDEKKYRTIDQDDMGEIALHIPRSKAKTMRSCYDLKKLIYRAVKAAVPCSQSPSSFVNSCKYRIPHSNWYTNRDRYLVHNMVVYYPKWWEHTDLGFACDLYTKKTKDITPLDLSFYQYRRNRRNEVSATDIENYKRQATQNIKSLEEAMDALEYVIGLEVLEARYHANDASKKGKICSPHTETRLVAKTPEKGPNPDWHRLFSHAVLDARQEFTSEGRLNQATRKTLDWVTPKPFNAFISKHPYPNYSNDRYRQHLMSEDVRYITYLSTYDPSKKGAIHPPGMPMLFIPGTDYVAPEMAKDPDALGITVYSHPLAVCTPQSDDTKRAIRIFN